MRISTTQEKYPIGSMVNHYGRTGKVYDYSFANMIRVYIHLDDNRVESQTIDANELTLVRGDDEKEITISITGRRWFQKSYGNTYHSCKVYVNGEYAGQSDFVYGYGYQFEQTGLNIANEYIQENFDFSIADTAWGREAQKVKIFSSVSDVPRKKDLAF